MNLYIRYFDDEALVYNVGEAMRFLSSLDGVEANDAIRTELEKFMQSNAMYPKHVKVHARSFFIAIKTTAQTMEEFKTKGISKEQSARNKEQEKAAQKEALAQLSKHQPGWYAAKITFKRVVIAPQTQKCHYVDTPFICKVKAESAQDCYEKVVGHLRGRQEVDGRSQYPSIKSQNFEWNFLG